MIDSPDSNAIVRPTTARRKVNRRTFVQIRLEQRREDARFLLVQAEKLKASGQPDEASALTAAAGMITAGFAEPEGGAR